MRNDVGGGELAGIARTAAEAGLDLAEEIGVEKDLLVRRAVERPHRRLRHAAAPAIGGVAKQHDARSGKGLSAFLEDFAPAIVDFAEHAGDHAAHLVLRRTGLGRRRLPVGLIAWRRTAAENFRAADQDAGIDAERPADETEHDDGADAEPAPAAHRDSEATA